MNKQKIDFLKNGLFGFLKNLKPEQNGNWGVMNAQQMIEHLSDYVRIASGKDKKEIVYSPEIVQKAYSFMLTERPFRENTPNQLMPDVPPPFRNPSMEEALAELRVEMEYFFKVFSENPGLKFTNPFFGQLNYEEQVHLLHKHCLHHARQFGFSTE